MKHIFIFYLFIICLSCGKRKVVQLPEISHSEITNIKDVSVAYIFYNDTKPDSTELNRRNLISTTNWLVNVDKRLTLKQAIPHIKFLQDKKRNSSHKNENAKNYFTCNDTIRKNLGFIDFTNVIYTIIKNQTITIPLEYEVTTTFIYFNKNEEVFIINPHKKPFINKSNKNQLIKDLKEIFTSEDNISLRFDKELPFQNYITIKSILSKNNTENLKISNTEFIHN